MENPDALFVLLLWFDLSMWNFGFIVFLITRARAEVNVTIVIFWLRTSRLGDGSVTCPKSVFENYPLSVNRAIFLGRPPRRTLS